MKHSETRTFTPTKYLVVSIKLYIDKKYLLDFNVGRIIAIEPHVFPLYLYIIQSNPDFVAALCIVFDVLYIDSKKK